MLHEDFDRDFKRHQRWIRYYGIAVSTLVMTMFVGAILAIAYFVNNPDAVGKQLGSFFGSVVEGYEDERR